MLSEYISTRKRNNNLNLIRLIAACSVIFSHSYELMGVQEKSLFNYSKLNISIGGLAVQVFFIISGFLIFLSYKRSNSIKQYLKNRILRIFPGLFFSSLLVIVVTMLVSSLKIGTESIFNIKFIKNFLLLAFALPTHEPDLFNNLPFSDALNGSLWTIKYEFAAYIGILILGIIKMDTKRWISLFTSFSIIIYILNISGIIVVPGFIHPILPLIMSFLVGMSIYIYQDKIKTNLFWFILITAVLVISFIFNFGILFHIVFALFGWYVVMYIGYVFPFVMQSFIAKGDFSYGMYIYAFPIQQYLILLLGDTIHPVNLFIIATLITAPFAYLSWNLVEKKALSFK